MIDRDEMIKLLHHWGMWQRSAKNPNLRYSLSQTDTPLLKRRIVKPIYRSKSAEALDQLMGKYLPSEYVLALELTYVAKKINPVAADILKCSIKTFTIKRNEAISALRGVYTVATEING